MDVQTREAPLQLAQAADGPPLHPGDHLSRAEFERRYQANPQIKKAELIEGVVYMPSPTHAEAHGRLHALIMMWLGIYAAATLGTSVYDNTTVRLDLENEVQPDAVLRLDTSLGGRSGLTEDDYLEGPPELVVEIAASSAAYDLHVKRRVYARSGVPEYVAVQAYEQRVDWFVLREGVYAALPRDQEGLLRSVVFPGLWLDPAALLRGDGAAVLRVVQDGLASVEHAALVERLRV